MAGPSGNGNQFNPHSYLSPNQQDLLLAALSSNMNGNKNQFSSSNPDLTSMNVAQQQFGGATLDPSFFTSPQQNGSLSTFDAFGVDVDDSPYLDFADGDQNFDFGDYDDDQMIGPLPGDEDDDGGIHDKRKSPEGSAQPDGEHGAKRQEGEDKQAKKPGRKPLTSEPTTVILPRHGKYAQNTDSAQKRKAQNRAAQRAFRERKEKHLKDLEEKVGDLEKQSEAEKHENGLLRAQVERLQTELREYRKRLSLNSGRLSGSPPVGGYSSYLANLANQNNTNTNGASNNFQFEFPRFGGLPGAHIFNNGSLGKHDSKSTPDLSKQSPANGVLTRTESTGHSVSPKSQLNGVAGQNNAIDAATGLFSSAMTNGHTAAPEQGVNRTSTDSSSARSRVFQFNSGSTPSNSDSPSASSTSQFGGGANSSCGTSPEPSHNSPSAKETNPDQVNEKGYVCYGNSEGEIQFCEKLNMACGNPRNPVPRAKSYTSDGAPATVNTPAATAKTPGAPSELNNGIDLMATQNGGQFDPALFGDYRESNAAIVGDGDFTGGFFNDAFAMPDFGSPFNVGETPAIQKTNPMEEIERLQESVDEDEVVPGDDMSQMLSCHSIWYDQILNVNSNVLNRLLTGYEQGQAATKPRLQGWFVRH